MRSLLLAVLGDPAARRSRRRGADLAPAADVPSRPRRRRRPVPTSPSRRTGPSVAVWVAQVGGANLACRRRVPLARPGVRAGGRRSRRPTVATPRTSRSAMDGAGNATVAVGGGERSGRRSTDPRARSAGRIAEPGRPRPSLSLGAVSSRPVVGVGASGPAVIACSRTGERGTQRARGDPHGPGRRLRQTCTTLSGRSTPPFERRSVGVDDAGDAVVAWQRNVGAADRIEANDSRPAAAFGNGDRHHRVSNAVLSCHQPALASHRTGTTVVLWSESRPRRRRVQRAHAGGHWLADRKIASPHRPTAVRSRRRHGRRRQCGSAWRATGGRPAFVPAGRCAPPAARSDGSTRDLTVDGRVALDVAMNRPGDAIVTFDEADGRAHRQHRRPRGGDFGGVLSGGHRATTSTTLVQPGGRDRRRGQRDRPLDPQHRNPAATWELAGGALDAAPPNLSVSVPPGGTAGQAVSMAAAAADRLTPASIHWAFGDGGTASGGAVSHAFGSAGAFTVTVTATDGVGNATARHPARSSSPPAPKKRITSRVRVTWGVSGRSSSSSGSASPACRRARRRS